VGTITRRKLTDADIALAIELRTAGVQWIHIATGLGVTAKTLRRAVTEAQEYGYRKTAEKVRRRNHSRAVNEKAAGIIGSGARKIQGMGGGPSAQCLGIKA
jgi:hypothetical protein